ncbi:MAG: rRNA maturation RNase YbeY [Patescibacteria group bacterium]
MISFTNLTSKSIRRRTFEKLYHKALPKTFELSVVFATPSFMRKLNKKYRRKDKIANVLSFLIDKSSGEIFLNRNEKNLPYLFVHGCLHLNGYDHKNDKDAARMEKLEDKILNS